MASIINPVPYKIKKKPLWFFEWIGSVSTQNWYHQLKASKQFDELTLQRVLKYKFDALVPHHSAIYYNKTIVSSLNIYDKCKPDFLLWKNDYSIWYVIEVEMQNHDKNHIDKQLRTFYNGDYSNVDAISTYVCDKLSSTDKEKFASMIASMRPQVILMADHIHCDWRKDFSGYGCLFSTLQMYTDGQEYFVYRFGGEFPMEVLDFTYSNLDKNIIALDIDVPDFLEKRGFKDGDLVPIFYLGESEEWKYLKGVENPQLVYTEVFSRIDLSQKRWRLIVNHLNQIHLTK